VKGQYQWNEIYSKQTASEVTTLWWDKNVCIIIIILLLWKAGSMQGDQLCETSQCAQCDI